MPATQGDYKVIAPMLIGVHTRYGTAFVRDSLIKLHIRKGIVKLLGGSAAF